MTFAVLLIAYVAANTAGLLLLRTSLPEVDTLREALLHPGVLGGGALYATSFLVWMLALRRYELTLAYPAFMGLGYAVVMVASVVVLGERLTGVHGAGIALVAVGLVMLLR